MKHNNPLLNRTELSFIRGFLVLSCSWFKKKFKSKAVCKSVPNLSIMSVSTNGENFGTIFGDQ